MIKPMAMIEQEGIKIESKLLSSEGKVLLVKTSGYVDQGNCHLLQNVISESLNNQQFNLIFDFQELVYMSSAGWGVLIGEIKRFRESGGDIKLANMGAEIYEIYQMLEFYHIISEYPSVEAALKSFDKNADVDISKEVIADLPEPATSPEEGEEQELPLANDKADLQEILNENNFDEEPDRRRVPRDPIIEDELEINIEEILKDQGIRPGGTEPEKSPSYVPFDPTRYDREPNPKLMPIPDKIRAIVSQNPEFSVRKIRKALRDPENGGVKIGYFKLRSLLKSLELDTKQKRFRYFRSA